MKMTTLLCLLLIAVVGSAYAEEATVWRIGKFDGNYAEFAIAGNFNAYSATFPNDVTFRIGKDDPAKTWPFIQPGTVDPWAGSRRHPFAIVFDLPEDAKGIYTFRVALVNTHNSMPPALEIAINETSDRIDLPAGGPDGALIDASQGKKHEASLSISASFLRKGENRIVLTGVDGSHIMYDALSLTNNPGGTADEASIRNVTLSPTNRFVRKGGKLRRLAQLTAEFSAAAEKPMARVVIDGKSRTIQLKTSLFGRAMAEIEIEDSDKPYQAEVTVTTGGQSKSASCEVKPVRHWRLYILPTSHVDVGYTDRQENVKIRHNDNMNLALDLCRKYPDFTWNTEAAWVEDNYLSMAPPERKEEFLRRAKEGRVGCQAVYGNMLTGICSHESIIRDLYYARGVAKKHGIPFDMAMSTDVPTQVWTLPSVLAGSGIRYFAAGLNLVRANSAGRLFHKPFYWESPDGASVLTYLTPGYGAGGSLGLDQTMDKARAYVDGYLANFDREDYPYDAVFGHGYVADNVPLYAKFGEIVHEWNQTYAYPQIVLCRGPEFFQYIEKNFKDKIPTLKGDGGVYWEDGAGSSAKETAANRIAKEDLVAAEKLFALTGADYPADEITEAWKNIILYDEHTWGAAGSISEPESKMTRDQWAYKAKFARDSSKQAARLKEQAMDRLAKSIEVKEPSVVVFNPLSWPVTGIVQTENPRTVFTVDVPTMGFKVYPLSELPSPVLAIPAGDSIENCYYRVQFDHATGAVKSLFDKELNRELVDASSSYKLNEYIYMYGLGDAQKDAANKSVGSVNLSKIAGCGRQVMTVIGSAFNTPSFTTQVILYDNEKRIDFINLIDKNLVYEKEGGYFAFPFALTKPEFRIELPDGVVNPAKDMLDGGCMAWYCAQDFVAASDDTVSVVWTPVDSPLLTLCDVNYETAEGWNMPKAASNWPSKLDNGHIYGYAFNNYWFTNYKAGQSGKLTFRFSLTSMKAYDPVAASRFGQSVRNPLMVKVIQPAVSGLKSRNTKPGKSLCSISPSNVAIQAIKRAETGDGTIIRLRELSGKACKATVTAPALGFKQAWKCNLVEDPMGSLSVSKGAVSVDIPANGMVTVLVK